jgi:hypothetical protein
MAESYFDVAISYVIREADGISEVKNFLDSAYSWKVQGNEEFFITVKESSEKFFSDVHMLTENHCLDFRLIRGENGGFDIGSHFDLALNHIFSVYILMTASSLPTEKDWITKLVGPFSDVNVGLTGSMQTAESHYTNLRRINFLRYKTQIGIKLKGRELAEARIRGVEESVLGNSSNLRPRMFIAYLKRVFVSFQLLNISVSDLQFKSFPKFPNYHLRTTGIAIRRESFLSCVKKRPTNKIEAYLIESGKNSLVREVLSAGMQVLLIKKTGQVLQFPSAEGRFTFRSTTSESLVVDHEWNRYFSLGSDEQEVLTVLTHGDIVG